MGEPLPIQFGRYQLVERLAVGGMAELFVATVAGEHGFAKKVVIKRLLPHLSHDPTYTQMFINEAKITARLVHPKIAATHELGRFGNELFISMEYVDGFDALAMLRECAHRREQLEQHLAVWIAREVLDALDYAHQVVVEEGRGIGIVHRDISPSNVLLSERGDVKLVDFGIARIYDPTHAHQTKSGTLKGKYGYMSPEQVVESPLDPRSDLFSVGVVLAEMLTGRRLFAAANELDVLLMVRDAKLSRLDKYGDTIDPGLDVIVRQALKKNVDERWQSAGAFRDALDEWLFMQRQRVSAKMMAELVSTLREGVLAARKRDQAQETDMLTGVMQPEIARAAQQQERRESANSSTSMAAIHRAETVPAIVHVQDDDLLDLDSSPSISVSYDAESEPHAEAKPGHETESGRDAEPNAKPDSDLIAALDDSDLQFDLIGDVPPSAAGTPTTPPAAPPPAVARTTSNATPLATSRSATGIPVIRIPEPEPLPKAPRSTTRDAGTTVARSTTKNTTVPVVVPTSTSKIPPARGSTPAPIPAIARTSTPGSMPPIPAAPRSVTPLPTGRAKQKPPTVPVVRIKSESAAPNAPAVSRTLTGENQPFLERVAAGDIALTPDGVPIDLFSPIVDVVVPDVPHSSSKFNSIEAAIESLMPHGTAETSLDFDDSAVEPDRIVPPPPSSSELDAAARTRPPTPPGLAEISAEPDEVGDFSTAPPLRVLFRLMTTRVTGLLSVSVGGIKKEIYFRDGAPEYVTSNVASELFGNYLVGKGVMSDGEMAMALAMMPHYGGKLGDTLVGLGLLKPLEVFRHLTRQVRSKIIDVCTWTRGQYAWYAGRENTREAFPLDLNTFEVIGAGAMTVPQATLDDWFERFRDARWKGARSKRIEPERFEIPRLTDLFESLDGKRTLADIIDGTSDKVERTRTLRAMFLLDSCELIKAA